MGKLAFIFPGQGVQTPGMGKDFYEAFSVSSNVYDRADKIRPVSTLCFEATEEELKLTYNSQVAIVTTSLAMYEAFKSMCDIEPDYVLGHSLGEYCALYSAGVFDLESAVKLISKRSELMHEAAEENHGTMAAVIGLKADIISEYVKNIDGVYIANYNSPEQVVITGLVSSVSEAEQVLKEAGAKRVVPLSVSGAFHSPFMKNASNQFVQYLKDFEFKDAKYPVITNIDAKETVKGEELKHKLPFQIHTSVYWVQSVKYLISQGVDTFVEIGPGKVLAGLNKRISPDIKTYNINSLESLQETIKIMKVSL
ncbi:ACP S-malonyltransferase [bacterium]|nr:ACP S-malonyltransferase [bacterium]